MNTTTRTHHDFAQGTEAWHQFRLTKFGASEAAAMLGLSATMTRAELLRMKHTGLAREYSDWLQAHVLDRGHEVEALARPHAEAFIEEDLFPVTRSMGRLSASCDGLTLDDSIAWEHKQWSESLADRMTVGIMPAEHMPQCQQVLLVTGARQLLFTVSDGTPERMLHLWVEPDPAWFERLQQGWQQFEADLMAYVLPESAPAAPTGKAPDTLPALRIEVTGEVTASNLAEFKATALAAIRSVNRELRTDADFADAAKAVTWCSDVESRLKAAKEHALSQTASIDALFKAIDDISTEARAVRLDLEKLVTRRKVEVKEQAVTLARKALDDHIATLNAELAPMLLRPVPADFAGAIKGLRTVASMQDALDTALANGKIAADAQARGIRANVTAFTAQAAGLEFLFADLGQLVHKAADDFAALLQARIATHRAAEAEKARKAAEAEAARIAAAEQRAREQEAARIAAEQAEAARVAAQQAEDARVAALAEQRRQDAKAESARIAQQAAQTAQQAAPAPVAAPTPAPAPAAAAPVAPTVKECLPVARADEPATLKLGDICARLLFTVRCDFVADTLHVKPARIERGIGYFTESQYATICRQLISHVAAMAELYAGEPA